MFAKRGRGTVKDGNVALGDFEFDVAYEPPSSLLGGEPPQATTIVVIRLRCYLGELEPYLSP